MAVLFNPWMLSVLVMALLVYWVLLTKLSHRLIWVTCVSIVLLAWLHPWFALIAEGVVSGLWLTGTRRSGRALLGSILVAVGLVALGKYGKEIAQVLYPAGDAFTRSFVMPLGISYFAFRLIQVAYDNYREEIGESSWIRYQAFFFFFPTFLAGPLETYQGFFKKQTLSFDPLLFQQGLRQTVVGYFKKLVLVDLILRDGAGPLFNHFIDGNGDLGALGPCAPWKFVVLCFARAYLDLSAYSDIAIGISALFGFRILQNFNAPFLKSNLPAFWRSWHVSLSTWCRDQVYFPVFGWLRRPWIATYASLLVMGLWHQVGLNWLVWSAYHGTGLVFVGWWSRWKRRRPSVEKMCLHPLWKVAGIVMTFWFVALGYAFVSVPRFSRACDVWIACVRSVSLRRRL
jgi:alginate O-acetyltransferase complex protein AlgI